MPATASELSQLKLIRSDGDAVRQFPEEVRRAAELLAAYIAGFDQGLQRAAPAAEPVPAQPPATDPGNLPGGGGTPAASEIEALAETQLAAETVAAGGPGGGVKSGACRPVAVFGSYSPDASPPSPEIVLVWGRDCYQTLMKL